MRRFIPIFATAFLALTIAAVAAIGIYSNGFSTRGQYSDIEKLSGGKKCGKSWRNKKSLGFEVKAGRQDCVLGTPVEGDSKRPDHIVEVEAKVTKKTSKKVRDRAYVGVAARVSKKTSYEFRVLPKPGVWKLLRNGKQVEKGDSKKIAEIGKRNELEIRVVDAKVSASVAGKRLVRFKDPDGSKVAGRRTAVTYGSGSKADKEVVGLFDDLKVKLAS